MGGIELVYSKGDIGFYLDLMCSGVGADRVE